MKYFMIFLAMSLFAINGTSKPKVEPTQADTTALSRPIKTSTAVAPKPKRTVPPPAPSIKPTNGAKAVKQKVNRATH